MALCHECTSIFIQMFYKDTSYIGLDPPIQPDFTFTSYVYDPISKYGHILM